MFLKVSLFIVTGYLLSQNVIPIGLLLSNFNWFKNTWLYYLYNQLFINSIL